MRTFKRTKQRKEDSRRWHQSNWGNYKSDKWKSKAIMREEIRSLLIHGDYTKDQLIEIRDFLQERAWK
jgi:hypothetical protein